MSENSSGISILDVPKKDNGASHKMVLIGMPNWSVEGPFHSLALVGGIAKEANFPFEVYDLNVDFYKHVEEGDAQNWGADELPLWFDQSLPGKLWKKYESWLLPSLNAIISEDSPTLIAFSVNMSNREFSIRAARYIKNKFPRIPVLFGGVDCFPREYHAKFLTEDGCCDIICHGESEIAFSRFLKEFKQTGSLKTAIPGFTYMHGNQLVDTGPAELPTLQEQMPIPVYERFDLSKYTAKGHLPFFLTRGCVYKCTFCSEVRNFTSYRFRNADEAFRELQAILPFAQKQAEVPTIKLGDSIINANIKELSRFVDLILEHGVKIMWGGQGHIHGKMTYEVLERMKQSGFLSVFWGVETGSQHVVDLMLKKYSMEDAHRIFKDCIKLGIIQHIPIILGHPGETPGDVVETLKLMAQYKDKMNFHLPSQVILRPNSPLFDEFYEFELANNDPYGWSTKDNTNTLPIRIIRRFLARQMLGNSDLSMENLQDYEEIKAIDLNSPPHSAEFFNLLYETALEGQCLERFYFLVSELNRGNSSDAFEGSEEEKGRVLKLWLKIDINSPEGRDRLYKLSLEVLRLFNKSVREEDLVSH